MRFGATYFQPRTRLEYHAREVSYLSLVLAGSYVERVGAECITCLPLSVRFHPAGEEHAHVFGQGGSECLNFELDEAWSESLRGLLAARRAVHVVSAGALGLDLIGRYRRGQLHDMLAISFAAELLLLCEKQLDFVRAMGRSEPVRRAIDFIEGHLSDDVGLAMIAADVGLHPTHLARSFKRATGLTVGEYIRKRRRERGEALLMQYPARTISRVAAEAGFADHAHMTRTFKTDIGVAPSAYRAALSIQ